jgi:hypothetical protein
MAEALASIKSTNGGRIIMLLTNSQSLDFNDCHSFPAVVVSLHQPDTLHPSKDNTVMLQAYFLDGTILVTAIFGISIHAVPYCTINDFSPSKSSLGCGIRTHVFSLAVVSCRLQPLSQPH